MAFKKQLPILYSTIGLAVIVIFVLSFKGETLSWSRDDSIGVDSEGTVSDRKNDRTPSRERRMPLAKDDLLNFLRFGSPESILDYISENPISESNQKDSIITLGSRLGDFSDTEILRLNSLVPGGALDELIANLYAAKWSDIDDVKVFFEELRYFRENSLGDQHLQGSLDTILARIVENVALKGKFSLPPRKFEQFIELFSDKPNLVDRFVMDSLTSHVEKLEFEKQVETAQTLLSTIEDSVARERINDFYTNLLIDSGTSYIEIGEWLIGLSPNESTRALGTLIENALSKNDEAWTFEFANRWLEVHADTTDDDYIVTELARNLADENPRRAVDWALSIPYGTPGREAAILRSFSALQRPRCQAKNNLDAP